MPQRLSCAEGQSPIIAVQIKLAASLYSPLDISDSGGIIYVTRQVYIHYTIDMGFIH